MINFGLLNYYVQPLAIPRQLAPMYAKINTKHAYVFDAKTTNKSHNQSYVCLNK